MSTADWLTAMVTGDAMEGDGQSGLVFLFAPIYQWLAVIVTTGAALIVHALLSRRARARL